MSWHSPLRLLAPLLPLGRLLTPLRLPLDRLLDTPLRLLRLPLGGLLTPLWLPWRLLTTPLWLPWRLLTTPLRLPRGRLLAPPRLRLSPVLLRLLWPWLRRRR
ncbi:hypothetical protein [Nocardia sp. CNY236]|uniref:hypothetical protein n=1 Tax=Nocardia sp. CNY236 TaxID=1169152 RepID=UPI00048F7507|nr:hypothetical protein [Nocardia sp. CNY236]